MIDLNDFKSGVSNLKFESGRDGEIRTHDFLLPKQALYQAELRPVMLGEERAVIVPHKDKGAR